MNREDGQRNGLSKMTSWIDVVLLFGAKREWQQSSIQKSNFIFQVFSALPDEMAVATQYKHEKGLDEVCWSLCKQHYLVRKSLNYLHFLAVNESVSRQFMIDHLSLTCLL